MIRSAKDSDHLAAAGMTGRWAIARIGLDHDYLLDVSGDDRAVLLHAAGGDYGHVFRDRRRRIRTVAGLARPGVGARWLGCSVLESLEVVRAGATTHWIVLRPL